MGFDSSNNNKGNPQKEDGYTPIANELLEAILCADFTKRQLLIIMTIARMTYGYSKKSDALSSVQIANATGINRPKVSEAINELVDKNVIVKLDSGRQAHGHFVNQIMINKKYKEWLLTDTKTIPDNRYQNGTSTEMGTDTKVVSITDTKMGTQQIPKRDTHKAIKTIKTNMSDFNEFWSLYPNKSNKKKASQSWLKNKPVLETVLNALDWQIPHWAKDDFTYCPMPTTYINQERWNDEPIAKPKKQIGLVL